MTKKPASVAAAALILTLLLSACAAESWAPVENSGDVSRTIPAAPATPQPAEEEAPKTPDAASEDAASDESAFAEPAEPSGQQYSLTLSHTFLSIEHNWTLDFFESQAMSLSTIRDNVKHILITPENVSDYYRQSHQSLTMTYADSTGRSTEEGDLIEPIEDSVYIDRFSHSYVPGFTMTGSNFHSELEKHPDGSVEIVHNETVPYEQTFAFACEPGAFPPEELTILEEEGAPVRVEENQLTGLELTEADGIYSYLPARAFHWIPLEEGFSYLPFLDPDGMVLAVIVRNECLTDVVWNGNYCLTYVRDGKPHRPVSYTYYSFVDDYGLSKSSAGYGDMLEYHSLSVPVSNICRKYLMDAVLIAPIDFDEYPDSEPCGCIRCGKTFSFGEVSAFAGNPGSRYPLCPYCSDTSVITGDSGFELCEETLLGLRKYVYPHLSDAEE